LANTSTLSKRSTGPWRLSSIPA